MENGHLGCHLAFAIQIWTVKMPDFLMVGFQIPAVAVNLLVNLSPDFYRTKPNKPEFFRTCCAFASSSTILVVEIGNQSWAKKTEQFVRAHS